MFHTEVRTVNSGTVSDHDDKLLHEIRQVRHDILSHVLAERLQRVVGPGQGATLRTHLIGYLLTQHRQDLGISDKEISRSYLRSCRL